MVEFTDALARLLRDGKLREQFAADPALALKDMVLSNGDRSALVQLPPDELEMQAVVLLRKRFDEVQRILAATCASLGEAAWPLFRKHARYYWPDGENDGWADAQGFTAHLVDECAAALNSAEKNRTAFAVSAQRWGVAFTRKLPVGDRFRPAIQIFWRRQGKTWREIAVFLAL